MNIALIAQISAGVAFPGALSVWMFAPHWLGIYSDVDIYLSSVSTTSQNADANFDQQNVVQNNNDLKCKITGEMYEESCALTTLSAASTANTFINVKDFTVAATIPSTAKDQTTTTYYKMVVSQKLLWKLPKDKASTTFSVSLNQSGNPSLTLKPLFYKDQSKITSLDNTKAIQHYIGKVTKINNTDTEITKDSTNDYQCSQSNNGTYTNCKIFNLQTGTTATTDLNNFTFAENTSEVAKITENNFYLIKDNEWNGHSFVNVKSGTATDNKIMQIKKLKPAFVVGNDGSKKIIIF